jgi:hypothetical protein
MLVERRMLEPNNPHIVYIDLSFPQRVLDLLKLAQGSPIFSTVSVATMSPELLYTYWSFNSEDVIHSFWV